MSITGLVQCSFCGKDRRECRRLIMGPGVYICDECITLCADIIGYEGNGSQPTTTALALEPFMDRARNGDVSDIAEIDHDIATWHTATMNKSLSEWLGMTDGEYARYLADTKALHSIIQSRQEKSAP